MPKTRTVQRLTHERAREACSGAPSLRKARADSLTSRSPCHAATPRLRSVRFSSGCCWPLPLPLPISWFWLHFPVLNLVLIAVTINGEVLVEIQSFTASYITSVSAFTSSFFLLSFQSFFGFPVFFFISLSPPPPLFSLYPPLTTSVRLLCLCACESSSAFLLSLSL